MMFFIPLTLPDAHKDPIALATQFLRKLRLVEERESALEMWIQGHPSSVTSWVAQENVSPQFLIHEVGLPRSLCRAAVRARFSSRVPQHIPKVFGVKVGQLCRSAHHSVLYDT